MKIINGGVTSPKGFKATGDHVGLKKMKKDLSIIISDMPCHYAGTYTTNVVKAACVTWNQKQNNSKIKGVVINSGNANACTGVIGEANNEKIADKLARVLNTTKESVLVASTGVIGQQLKIEKLLAGIDQLAPQLGETIEHGNDAALGILTTDTHTKQIAVEFMLGDKKVTIGAMGKGSGMIHPNMATMLSFVTTDVNITKEMLDLAVKEDVEDTYNMISVDGDTSTNDMVITLANGLADNDIIDDKSESFIQFKEALHVVNQYISRQIIGDGEGVTKVIEVHVNGADTVHNARTIGKSVITSNLVKTAFFGQDANWGRVLCAMGYSGVSFDPKKVSLYYESNNGKIKLLEEGLPIEFDEDLALKILKDREITVNIILEEGDASAIALGCDLSYDYVKINGEYRT